MDIKAHETITNAVQHLEGVQVIPTPEANDNIRFLTITTPDEILAAVVLNALNEENLLGKTESEFRRMQIVTRPHLGVVGMIATGITLEHLNA